MKLILYKWGGYTDDLLWKELIEAGHDVVIYDNKCQHYTRDLIFAQGLINLIHANEALAVISNDYFPIISMVCKTLNIDYYSWIYDSPHYTLFSRMTGYECNHIGCFDRDLVKQLRDKGISTVKHLPLGCGWRDLPIEPTDDNNKITNPSSAGNDTRISRYESSISFVGSLYTDEYNYYDAFNDAHIRQQADIIIKKQCFDYKTDYISSFFSNKKDNIDELRKRVRDILVSENLLPGDDYLEDIEYIFNSSYLEKKVTIEERRQLLTTIAERYQDFAMFTGSDLSDMPVLKRHSRGYIDYFNEMPKVFRNSQINLNITLRSIKSGIPLRALDIMGCGGFLLSNYQKELDEYFEEGKEMVMFYSLEDCLEKISYYLAHEDIRKKISISGYEAVAKRFNYRNQLNKLLTEI